MTANPTAAKVADPKAADSKAARTPADGRVYQQAELPDDVRRDLPKLVIGGASYSGDAASRMVMINGQIFHEGDQLAPQLVLERIKLKSAVLSYKGYRYEVTF
jgi:general secretion pathway protein B